MKSQKVRSSPCKSCPFKSNKLQLSPERMLEIYSYLFQGFNHSCHSDRTNSTVCFGGREVQLRFFTAMGWIEEPTNEALARAMVGKN